MFANTNLNGIGVRWGVPADWPELTAFVAVSREYAAEMEAAGLN